MKKILWTYYAIPNDSFWLSKFYHGLSNPNSRPFDFDFLVKSGFRKIGTRMEKKL
jgi:hypothetical protein